MKPKRKIAKYVVRPTYDVMIMDGNTSIIAHAIIDEYGEHAKAHIHQRIASLLEKGDVKEVSMWMAILQNICCLLESEEQRIH